VQGNYHGEHTKIKDSLNQAIDNLDRALQSVSASSQEVNAAAAQISRGNQAFAASTSEQASSLEEISSSLEEMSSMTVQNNSNAIDAQSMSENAGISAAQGMTNMQRLSEIIHKIKNSSDETAKIIETIDDIAFQTNLLALNAAVEAARAGESGKGFAVVAEEVRNLAIRSAEAARNTTNLIQDSVRNSVAGVDMNQEVSNNLKDINQQITRVNEAMKEITTASAQQTEGIAQINKALEQLDQLAQQNAAGTQEAASAAEELLSQAEEMRSMVNGFNLSQSARTHSARAESIAPDRIRKKNMSAPKRLVFEGLHSEEESLKAF